MNSLESFDIAVKLPDGRHTLSIIPYKHLERPAFREYLMVLDGIKAGTIASDDSVWVAVENSAWDHEGIQLIGSQIDQHYDLQLNLVSEFITSLPDPHF